MVIATTNTIKTAVADTEAHSLITDNNLKFANDASDSEVPYDKNQMGALSYKVTANGGIRGINIGDKYDGVAKLAINPDNSEDGGQADEKGIITIKVKLAGGTKYKPTEFTYDVTYN